MKKIHLILAFLISFASFAQAEFPEGIQLTNQTSTTATKVNVQENDGTINTKPLSELANYVEFASAVNLPVMGEQGKLYLTKDNNRLYRFNGTIYQELTTDISGKEDIANKQNSLAFDGTGVKYPTVNAVIAGLSTKQNYLDWATPQDYGAIGDGIADDTAAVQACLNSNSNVLLYGNYKTTDYLEVFSNQFIFSNNATITRSSTASAILVALNRENIQIKGSLTLVGSGNFEGTSSGIKMSGVDNFKVDGVVFKNISGVGLWISAGSVSFPRGKGGLISNIQAINCYIGMQFDYGAQGEYHSVVNFNATECNTGANIYAGNISITGGNIVDNTLGIYLGGFLSSNNSHGILNGININHNTLNLKVDGAEFGESIQGCHFYGEIDSNIEIINSKGISFTNCIIDGLVSVTGVGTHIISNTQIESQTSFTGSKINIIDCFTKDGGMYIGNGYDIKGVNHAVGLGYNDFGNIHIYTDGEFSINKGGTLSLGGAYNSTGSQASFAKIHGKSETSTTGSLAGYMAFEVSNNSTSPYSREVGRFSSTGDFKVVGTVTATSYTATSLPVFENNAAASSLAVGQFYRTSIGVLMVKF